jgi:hypothetical protein
VHGDDSIIWVRARPPRPANAVRPHRRIRAAVGTHISTVVVRVARHGNVWVPGGAGDPQVLSAHTGSVWAVAVGADGETAVSGGRDSLPRNISTRQPDRSDPPGFNHLIQGTWKFLKPLLCP